jgi:hypothetical protein
MAGRPCNPDSDLKRLWQALLPGTPFPQCGVARDTQGAAPDSKAAQPQDQREPDPVPLAARES